MCATTLCFATGANNRQVDSIVDEIEEKVAEACGEHPFSIEGREQKTWMLMDYGSVVVHVFTPKPATSIVSRSSGVTLPSFPSTSSRSSFETGF